MSRNWDRFLAVNVNNNGFYGWAEGPALDISWTLLRSLWSINLWSTWGDTDQYPPGSSIARAGIIAAQSGLTGVDVPTPISQSGEEWIDLVTLIPLGQIATSTGVDWQYNWSILEDRNAKAQRFNQTDTPQSIYLSWEFIVASDAVSGFSMLGWSGAVDAYLNKP